MTGDDREPSLDALFAEARRELPPDGFLTQTLRRTDALKRRLFMRRVAIGAALSLLAMPLQDFALAATPVLMHSLIDLPTGWVAQMLAPANSVAGLLSAVLLTLRAAHRRLFT